MNEYYGFWGSLWMVLKGKRIRRDTGQFIMQLLMKKYPEYFNKKPEKTKSIQLNPSLSKSIELAERRK